MKIKCIVILGLTTFGLMAFAGCGGDDSADTTAETPPPEPTAAPEFPAEAAVALDRLNASLDRLKLLAASVPDCGKEPQIRRERLRVRRLAGQLAAATGITYRRNKKHLSPQQADEIRSRLDAAADTEGPSIRRFVRAGTSAVWQPTPPKVRSAPAPPLVVTEQRSGSVPTRKQ